MAARYYSSDALPTVLTSSLGASGNPVVLGQPGTWPTSFPYCILVDWGTSSQEAMLVTGVPTGSGPYTLPVTRGTDGTSAQSHLAGASVVHGTTGYEPTLVQTLSGEVTTLSGEVSNAVQLGGDINGGTTTAPQVTGTHLSSALPVNQGGSGSITAAGAPWSSLLTKTAVKTTTYSAASGDYVACDSTSGTFTVTLPNAPALNTVVGVKLIASASPANAVTVACAGSDVLNKTGGATSYALSLLNQGATFQYGTGGIWLIQNDDLPLGSLDGRYNQRPSTTEVTYYVSAASYASDSNDGLSVHSAKATIAGALAALGSNAGTILVGAGTFTISSADGSGNGVSLTVQGTRLIGAGQDLTTIKITANVTWGVVCLAQLCSVEHLMVQFPSGVTASYGCGVSTPSSTGSCEHCSIDNVFVNTASNLTAAFAIGPDHSGSSSMDIAWTELRHCYFNTNVTVTSGYLIGNGTSGNILANFAFGCAGGPATYGVTLAGSGIAWYGGGFEACTSADINVTHGAGANQFLFAGVRSELGNQVLNAGYIGLVGGMTLIDYIAGAYSPTGGSNIITWNAGGPLTLQGGYYTTTGGTTAFAVNTSGGSPPVAFAARDVVTDSASPYPAASAHIQRCIENAQTTNGGTTNAEPASGFAFLVDGFTVSASNLPAVDVQWYTSTGSYTWTKPTGAQVVDIILCGGGGGGGSGSVQTTGNAGGGGGGQGGSLTMRSYAAADLTSSVTGSVGAGGGAGAAVSGTSATSGNVGSTGTATTFGTFAYVQGGNGGGAGTTAGGGGGSGNTGLGAQGGTGGAGGAAAAGGTSLAVGAATGGGGGGGANTGSTFNGGAGNFSMSGSSANAAAGGVAGGASPGTGTLPTVKGTASCGGGGGGSVNTAGSTAQTGATPFYGGGGGGGGGAFYPGSGSAVTSGAGGVGGSGFALVITHFC